MSLLSFWLIMEAWISKLNIQIRLEGPKCWGNFITNILIGYKSYSWFLLNIILTAPPKNSKSLLRLSLNPLLSQNWSVCVPNNSRRPPPPPPSPSSVSVAPPTKLVLRTIRCSLTRNAHAAACSVVLCSPFVFLVFSLNCC